MSIDYNSKNRSAGTKRGGGKSANALTGVAKSRNGKNNNKFTGFVVRGGGNGPGNKLSGLQLNQVNRRVDTSYGKSHQVTRGGGHTSDRNVHGNPDVRPEC